MGLKKEISVELVYNIAAICSSTGHWRSVQLVQYYSVIQYSGFCVSLSRQPRVSVTLGSTWLQGQGWLIAVSLQNSFNHHDYDKNSRSQCRILGVIYFDIQLNVSYTNLLLILFAMWGFERIIQAAWGGGCHRQSILYSTCTM